MKIISQKAYGRAVTLALVGAIVVIGLELRRTRKMGIADQPLFDSARGTTRPTDRLAIHVGDIGFSAIPLQTAVAVLANRSGSNLDGDWPALRWNEMTPAGPRPAGITSTQPVTLQLQNPTLRQALEAICRQLEFPDGNSTGIAEDPSGILLLGLADRDGVQRSVTTLPRFYNVDDLIGAAAEFHPRPPRESLDYGALHPNAARQELDVLATALNNFAGPGDVGCFGHWLMVNGYEEAQANIAAVLDRIPPRPIGTIPIGAPSARVRRIGDYVAFGRMA